MTDRERIARILEPNIALVLRHHPDLYSEYMTQGSEYFECTNARKLREALESADRLIAAGLVFKDE